MPGLDINWFRKDKGFDPDVIKKSLERRYRDPKLVDDIIEKDNEWRKIRFELDMLNKDWNALNEIFKQKKKANKEDPCVEELQKKKENELRQAEVKQQEKQFLIVLFALVNSVGNIVHDSVPVHQDEQFNKVERTWGEELPRIKITGKLGGLHHHEILAGIGGYDAARGQKIAGHRGYFLTGPGVLLNNALINYGINFLYKKNYQLVQPPFFMKREIMMETCQLTDFEENLYKVEGKGSEEVDNDYFLIATSEQPISALHRGEWIDEKSLPIKYGGTSTCFRKEAGAHGKDTWGIFRIHQFEKIEQFVICKPQQSWQIHEEMIKTSEEFMQTLGLPYQVINIVSGALNDAAAKKYDLEAWFPGYNAYRELVSTSNCTDFQSRNLEIRCGTKKADTKEKRYVHMLNGTLCATQRTLCCIFENYQTEEGLRVPEVLQPLVGTDFIPYTKDFIKEMKQKEEKELAKEQAKTEKKKGAKKEAKKEEAPKEGEEPKKEAEETKKEDGAEAQKEEVEAKKE